MAIRIRKIRTSRLLAAGALLGACAFFGLLFAQENGTGTGAAAPFDNIIHAYAGNMLERGESLPLRHFWQPGFRFFRR